MGAVGDLSRIKELAQTFCRNDHPVMSKNGSSNALYQKHSLPPYYQSQAIQKKDRKKRRLRTTGDDWFNMPAPELTDEIKNDLRAIRMRDTLDPSRFYKRNDMKGLQKYFQIGKIIESPADFYSSRVPKRQRKKTIVEELLQDAAFKSYRKKKANQLFNAKHQNARYFKKKDRKVLKEQKVKGKKLNRKPGGDEWIKSFGVFNVWDIFRSY